MTFHRGMHKYDENGRATEIEGYISTLFKWVIKQVESDVQDLKFVDIGCDYGYAMSLAENHFRDIAGLEPFPSKVNPFYDTEILHDKLSRSSLDQLVELGEQSFYWINHVLEHLEDPIGSLKMINSRHDAEFILLATPDAINGCDDFVYRKSHLSIYTEQWYRMVAPNILTNFELIAFDRQTLRGECTEIWALYRNKRSMP